MRSRLFAFARFLAAALLAVFLITLSRPARAGGTVTVTDASPKEDGNRWKLKMSMSYGGTPPTAHIPMSFTFTQTMLYERTLTDQSPKTPVLTKRAMINQPPIPTSMDVGFSDPTGKIYPTTKFDFVVTRDQGFEAGEYTLVIKRSNDGTQMGQQIRIVLQGENEVVDRRAIVFTGEKKEKKPDNAAASPEEKKDEGATGGGPTDTSGETSSEPPVETPPPAAPKQGGCGCRVAETSGSTGVGLVALLGIAALGARRRRR